MYTSSPDPLYIFAFQSNLGYRLFTSASCSVLTRVYDTKQSRPHTISSATTGHSLRRNDSNPIDELLNAVCMVQTFACAFWSLSYFSDKCGDIKTNLLLLLLLLLRLIIIIIIITITKCEISVSQEGAYRDAVELTAFVRLFQYEASSQSVRPPACYRKQNRWHLKDEIQ